MRLLIVRHAESKGNVKVGYSPATYDSLSGRGEKQASSLVDCLRSAHFDKIIVSPLQRALETLSPYLKATGQRAEIWPELGEACSHVEREAPSASWNKEPAPLSAEFSPFFAYRSGEAFQPVYPESFGNGLLRVHEAAARIRDMASRQHGTVLMLTHEHFIRELITVILDIRNVIRIHHDHCGMTLLSFDGVWTMEFSNRQPELS